jgi:hypothetical protein
LVSIGFDGFISTICVGATAWYELDAVVSRILGHSYDASTTPERLNLWSAWNARRGGCAPRGMS